VARHDDPEVVKREYATETGLLTRASVYADATGPDANDLLLEVIARRRPATVLEVGCGPGALAERLRDQHGITVRAIDALARRRGVDAQLGDLQHLPFPDESFERWELLGQEVYELSFNAENAREILERHFPAVDQDDVEGEVTFSDREMARRYVVASIHSSHLADQVPELTTPLTATRRNCILIASNSPDEQQRTAVRR